MPRLNPFAPCHKNVFLDLASARARTCTLTLKVHTQHIKQRHTDASIIPGILYYIFELFYALFAECVRACVRVKVCVRACVSFSPKAKCLESIHLFLLGIVCRIHTRLFPCWRFSSAETSQAGTQRAEAGKGAAAAATRIPPETSPARQHADLLPAAPERPHQGGTDLPEIAQESASDGKETTGER